MIRKTCFAPVALMLLALPVATQAQTKNSNEIVTITFTPNHA